MLNEKAGLVGLNESEEGREELRREAGRLLLRYVGDKNPGFNGLRRGIKIQNSFTQLLVPIRVRITSAIFLLMTGVFVDEKDIKEEIVGFYERLYSDDRE